ncbi:MAG: DUF2860 family protein [Desulfosarcinaceae bacterium]|jgi:hypothetical protein
MKRRIFFCHLVFALILISTTTQAQGPRETAPGWSGRIQAGGFGLQTDSQLSTEGTNRHTDDLDGPAAPHTMITGLASIDLRYQFESGTAFYAGNPLEAGKGLGVSAGVSQPLGASVLDVSVKWLPLEKVWKNPYLTSSARDKTIVDAYGLKVEWQQIGGSPWQLSYAIDRFDVRHDHIGDLDEDLRRDGWTHELGAQYTLPLAPGMLLKPHLKYAYADKEGRSNRYHGVEAGGLIQRARPPWVLVGFLSGAYHHYPEDHPLFDKARKDGVLTLFALVTRLNLFGYPRLFASLGAGYIRSDSNIDFFDSQTLLGLTSVGVNF